MTKLRVAFSNFPKAQKKNILLSYSWEGQS